MMNPTAFIYGEQPHKELFVYEVPLWSFNDKDNVHEIENQKQMAEEIVATRGSLNNHLIYSQEDYPGIINDASGIEPVAKVSRIKYNEETKTFVADITSTNQQFIEMIAATEYFPRVHPCYEAETNPRFVGYLTTVSSTFKRLLCWLVETTKLMYQKISVEYHPEGRPDESKSDTDNEKDDRWETMRTGINATLKSFCDKIISSSIVGGSYEKSGSLRRITLGEKTIDIILQFDTDIDSWVIFIGDPTRPRILIDANGDITADIVSFIPNPLCFRDLQTLCDMLDVCRNKNWQVKEDTHEEQIKSCETSDDYNEEASKLIPKEELMKIIFENIKDVLKLNLSENKHAGKYQMNSWTLSVRADDSFEYIIHDRQKCVRKTIGCDFHKDHWDIFIDKYSNVNIFVYPKKALWVVDALVLGQHGDFPKEVLENIIKDINAWIKTKDTPKEEHSAFSQALIKDGKRPSKIDYYLAMAEVASTRGTCLRRRFGSVIVKDDRIVSTGYAGAPSGRQNCCDIGYCRREKLNAPRGKMYHLCRSCHSEQNAIINASKEEMLGATLYLAGVNIADGSIVKNADCCSMCKRFIINSGISRVIIKDPEKPEGYRAIDVSEWVSNDDSLDVEVGY